MGETNVDIKGKTPGKLHQIAMHFLAFLIGAIVASTIYQKVFIKEELPIQWIESGKMSVAISEHQELMFIDRNTGSPIIVDSMLTEIIERKIGAQKYLKTNKYE